MASHGNRGTKRSVPAAHRGPGSRPCAQASRPRRAFGQGRPALRDTRPLRPPRLSWWPFRAAAFPADPPLQALADNPKIYVGLDRKSCGTSAGLRHWSGHKSVDSRGQKRPSVPDGPNIPEAGRGFFAKSLKNHGVRWPMPETHRSWYGKCLSGIVCHDSAIPIVFVKRTHLYWPRPLRGRKPSRKCEGRVRLSIEGGFPTCNNA